MILLKRVHQTTVLLYDVFCDSLWSCFPRPVTITQLFLVKNAHDVAQQEPNKPNKAIDKILHNSTSYLFVYALFKTCK